MATDEDYQNAVRKITALTQERDEARDALSSLRSDAAYEPVRQLIRQIDSGTYKPTTEPAPAAPKNGNDDEEPKWFREKYAPKLTAWEKKDQAENEKRIKAAIAKIDEDEKKFREEHGHIPDEYFGPKGKINDFMAAHGIDDFGVGVRAVVPLELLTQKPKLTRAKAPLGGSPPSARDDDAPDSEGASINRAREAWTAQYGG